MGCCVRLLPDDTQENKDLLQSSSRCDSASMDFCLAWSSGDDCCSTTSVTEVSLLLLWLTYFSSSVPLAFFPRPHRRCQNHWSRRSRCRWCHCLHQQQHKHSHHHQHEHHHHHHPPPPHHHRRRRLVRTVRSRVSSQVRTLTLHNNTWRYCCRSVKLWKC